MKYLLIGIIVSLFTACLSLAVGEVEQAVSVTGGIGLFLTMLAIITSGSLVSGDRQRANFALETMSERHKRTTVSIRLVILGSPFLVLAGCVLYFFN